MPMLKVYIVENAAAEPRLMEVSADAPLSRVIPALVQELGLPLADLFGYPLMYVLRPLTGSQALPASASLHTAGVQSEAYLALEAFVADDAPVLASQPRRSLAQAPAFYTGQTIVDGSIFVEAGDSRPLVLPATPATFSPAPLPVAAPVEQRHRTRRALLLLGGAVVGASAVGLGYAAFNSLSSTLFPRGPRVFATPAATQTAVTPTAQATLPTRATSVLTFTQHRQTVRVLAWSADGKLLASGANDRLLLVWNLTGQVQLRKTQGAAVHAVAWSPDARQLAVASANQVLFFDALTGTLMTRSTRTHRATVTTLAWSTRQPQQLVSAGLDKLAAVWNTQTFKPRIFFRQHSTGILSATWAADGQTIATCSQGGVIRVWNAVDGQQVHGLFSDGTVTMNAVAFDPAGTRLAAGSMDGVLRIWQSGLTCQLAGNGNMQGQCLDKPTRLNGHTGPIRALAWSPDGRLLASAGDDAQVLIWNPAQSATPLLKIAQAAPVLSLAWSPDGKRIATAAGTLATIWELA